MLLLLSLGFAEHPPALGTNLDGVKASSKCFSKPVEEPFPQKGNFSVTRHNEFQKYPTNPTHFVHCVLHTLQSWAET